MKYAALIFLMLLTDPALADGSSQGHGMGGRFKDFDTIVAQYNASGERFRIEGHCQSACTIFLGIRNVCVDPNARLLFHAGHDQQRQISAKWTNHMLNHYNAKLRAHLAANHAMDTLSFFTISGADMISKFGYRSCR